MSKKIAVIGVGKVGLPMACHFSDLGHTVKIFDNYKELNNKLLNKINPLEYEPGIDLNALTSCKTLKEAVDFVDEIYIVVPTPQSADGTTLSGAPVVECLDQIEPLLKRATIVAVVSTLDPRDAEEVMRPRNNMRLVYNPPLIRLGSVKEDIAGANICFLGARNAQDQNEVFDTYYPKLNSIFSDKVAAEPIKGDIKSVACAKLAINASLSARIAWANDLKAKCDVIGADANVVFKAVRTDPRIGGRYMLPGAPPGGPCLPRDMDVWSTIGDTPLAKETKAWHKQTFNKLVEKTMLNLMTELHQERDKIAILGITYNPGGLDLTGSVGLEIARKWGKVSVYDPATKYLLKQENETFHIANSIQEAIDGAKIVVVGCKWPEIIEWMEVTTMKIITTDWR